MLKPIIHPERKISCHFCGEDRSVKYIIDKGKDQFYYVCNKCALTQILKMNKRFCESDCKHLGKKFQGYGGWLGFEFFACKATGEALKEEGDKLICCAECPNISIYV